MEIHCPGLDSLSGLFPLTHYQRYTLKRQTDKGGREQTNRKDGFPSLHTTVSRISENSFCIAWRFAVITQLPKWRVCSPVKGVQRRKPTTENRPKAKPKPFILCLAPGKQRWKFKEIRTFGFSCQASRKRPAPVVHWVGTRQSSLAASGAMCSHNLLKESCFKQKPSQTLRV